MWITFTALLWNPAFVATLVEWLALMEYWMCTALLDIVEDPEFAIVV